VFYDKFVKLANSINKSPSAIALECSVSKSTVTKWKRGGNPTDATKQKLADYFNVPVSHFDEPTDYLFEDKIIRKIPVIQENQKISNHLKALVDYFCENSDEFESEEIITEKDISKQLKIISLKLEYHADNLLFDNEPLTDEMKVSLKMGIKHTIDITKAILNIKDETDNN